VRVRTSLVQHPTQVLGFQVPRQTNLSIKTTIMSTTKSKKSKTSSKIDYSIYYNQPLIVVSCVKHSQKDGMFVTKFTSKLNNNPMIPMVSIGFNQFKKNELISMFENSKGYPTLTQTVDINTYQTLDKFITSYEAQLEQLNSLQ
tara:strand:+ start:14123 stop:14554 length:432 start_codon:yes stop_codon:yes gene_type:complete